MKKFYIKPRKDSPEVILEPDTAIFTIKGICHPENVTKFYEPVIHWLDEYKANLLKKNEKKDIKAIIFFRYFNSATYKYLLSLFQKLNEFTEFGCTLFIEWHYELDDEEMRECGEELFEFSGLKISHKCIESTF